ncbi:MaoC family dehydratase [Allosphingosinicella sp.]|uniref:MaoC family dehydratase n=1 Tax=Allosphingosinicella sp. TaxID=2823234 RepID=UPI002FC14E4E
MTLSALTIEDLRRRIGSEIGISNWIEVDQTLIDSFAHSTKDMDWMHIDPERASRDGPYGGTIAFGFWTLSMLTHFSHEIGMWPADVAYGLNYGLERVRWITPVRVGARIRMRCKLLDIEDRGEERFLIRTDNSLEIEGEERLALVAEWLGMFVRSTGESSAAPNA